MHLPRFTLAIPLLFMGLGCSEQEGGLTPVGGVEASPVRRERFVRRIHLDLTGAEPTTDELAAAVAMLEKQDNAKTRAGLAEALIQRPEFATLYVAELENRAFAGVTTEGIYGLYCPIIQQTDPACGACSPQIDCSGCDCPSLTSLAAERAALLAAPSDLAEGKATTAEIERRFAATQIYRINNASVTAQANVLFEDFLGRPAEADELANAAFMATGTIYPGSPAGLLFQRTGETYADLVDIVFDSEVYRDAAVDATFLRYLGRNASTTERNVLARGLDPEGPDVRPIIVTIVSSKEYFSL